MGMPIAFSDAADFSGMTGTKGLNISQVKHKAVIEVSEEGTTATASTAVVMVDTCSNCYPTAIILCRSTKKDWVLILQK